MGQCGQCVSEGGDVPAFNYPPLTDDEFHAPSLLPRGSQAAPKHYITCVWAGTRLILFFELLAVVCGYSCVTQSGLFAPEGAGIRFYK